MKVSIITAVRNAERAVRHTLRSIAEQDFADIEHIVVDGASTDDTVEVVREFGTRVSTLISERDSGIYQAFNKGLRCATGDLVAYLSAGDEYAGPDVVRRVVDAITAEGTDSIYGDLVIVDSVRRDRVRRRYRSGGFAVRRFGYGFMPAHPSTFIRRAVYEEHGGYDESYRIAGDFELLARLYARHGVSRAHIPRVLVRMQSGGISTSGFRSNWIISREMRRACKENGIPTNWAKLAMRIPVKAIDVALTRSACYWAR